MVRGNVSTQLLIVYSLWNNRILVGHSVVTEIGRSTEQFGGTCLEIPHKRHSGTGQCEASSAQTAVHDRLEIIDRDASGDDDLHFGVHIPSHG